MKKILFILLVVLGFAASVEAQATATSKLGWVQAAPSMQEAQEYVYRYYPDGSPVGVIFSSVFCGVSPIAEEFDCEVLFPGFVPGQHTIQITSSNTWGESERSIPLDFTYIGTGNPPNAPKGLRIIQTLGLTPQVIQPPRN